MVVTFVLEEGLPTSVLEGEVRAMAAALDRAGVAMVGGDTKVVERGKADGMYITTTGIGRLMPQVTHRSRDPFVPATRFSCPGRSEITASPSFLRVASLTLKRTCSQIPGAFCL